MNAPLTPETLDPDPVRQFGRWLADAMEFWQGRRDRVHDRLVYRRDADGSGWSVVRLAP